MLPVTKTSTAQSCCSVDPSGKPVYDGQPIELPVTRHQPFTYEKADPLADPTQTARASHQIEQFELDRQSPR
jgi:hypothetical protein